ncbi:MAG: methyl-accepting chemotaxis protein [Opitutaceae bacterium]
MQTFFSHAGESTHPAAAGFRPQPKPAPAGGSLRLERIAAFAVRLAAHGPRLAALAKEMNEQAKLQAASAAATAETMALVAKELARSVAELRGAAGEVDQALATVTRIAEQTRLLSINARIEAARSGERGRAFAVVADEVERLADHTGETTRAIEARVHDMKASLGRVEAVGGDRGRAGEGEQNLDAVNGRMQAMAQSADRQLESALHLSGCGTEMNGLTESLLLAIGTFRFEAHARAELAVGSLLPELRELLGDREGSEQQLIRWLGEHDYFELVYLTDPAGRQVVSNIGWEVDRVLREDRGFGRDWSQRPWFREAIGRHHVASTDIYRSTASGDYCFTVSAAVRRGAGAVLGVVGADVNFQRLIGQ